MTIVGAAIHVDVISVVTFFTGFEHTVSTNCRRRRGGGRRAFEMARGVAAVSVHIVSIITFFNATVQKTISAESSLAGAMSATGAVVAGIVISVITGFAGI